MAASNGSPEMVAMTRQFKLDMAEVEQARAAAEAVKAAEIERKHAAQQQTLDQLLTLQVKDAEERSERRKFWLRYVLGPGGLATVLAGSAFGVLRDPVEAPTKADITAIPAQMTATVERVQAGQQSNEDKIHRTMEVLLDQQVEHADSTQFLSDKIEAAHPRTKRIEAPASVRRGRKKADAIKKRRSEKKQKYDPADPFADLPKAKHPPLEVPDHEHQ